MLYGIILLLALCVQVHAAEQADARLLTRKDIARMILPAVWVDTVDNVPEDQGPTERTGSMNYDTFPVSGNNSVFGMYNLTWGGVDKQRAQTILQESSDTLSRDVALLVAAYEGAYMYPEDVADRLCQWIYAEPKDMFTIRVTIHPQHGDPVPLFLWNINRRPLTIQDDYTKYPGLTHWVESRDGKSGTRITNLAAHTKLAITHQR